MSLPTAASISCVCARMAAPTALSAARSISSSSPRQANVAYHSELGAYAQQAIWFSLSYLMRWPLCDQGPRTTPADEPVLSFCSRGAGQRSAAPTLR